MIASARTLVERIACTSCSVRVAWHPSQHAATAEHVGRVSLTSPTAIGTSDVASFESSPFDLSDSTTPRACSVKMKSMKTQCCTSAAARLFCAARAPSSSCPHPGRVGSGLEPQIRGYGLEHALRRARQSRGPLFSGRCLGWFGLTEKCINNASLFAKRRGPFLCPNRSHTWLS